MDGTCGTFMKNNSPGILLCYHGFYEKGCRFLIRKNDFELRNINNFAFDDEFEVDTIPDSKHDHINTRLANYHGYPLILGGNNVKLEMLVMTEFPLQWNEQPDYPYADRKVLFISLVTNEVYFRYYRYSVISLPSSVIYFGGQSRNGVNDWETTDRVAAYKIFEWKLLGNLVRPRHGHSSIKMGTTIYTFGGDYEQRLVLEIQKNVGFSTWHIQQYGSLGEC